MSFDWQITSLLLESINTQLSDLVASETQRFQNLSDLFPFPSTDT